MFLFPCWPGICECWIIKIVIENKIVLGVREIRVFNEFDLNPELDTPRKEIYIDYEKKYVQNFLPSRK